MASPWTTARCYGPAIAGLKEEGKLPAEPEHRQVKYLNNVVESDDGKLKRLIRPTLGFKTMKSAYATIKGFDIRCALGATRMASWVRCA